MLSRSISKLAFLPILVFSFTSMSFAKDETASVDTLPGMTITELANFDGQNGRKAYIAVDSVIYDVTDVKAWKGGKHKGNKAGNDVTAKIAKAPHQKSTLKKLNKVGKLIATPVPTDTTQN